MGTTVLEDIRYGLRVLRKAPGFTIAAVLTLALGIGANTAIFTLLDQAILRKLPVKEPDRLVLLRYTGRNNGYSHTRSDDSLYFSYPTYHDLRDQNTVLSGLIATAWAEVGVQWHNEPTLEDAELVSGNYFDVLGVRPALGRLLVQSDDVSQEGAAVVVLSYSYWQRRFDSDPHVINQAVLINGHPFTMVGVAAPGFHSVVSGDHPAVFVPMTMKPEITPGWNDLDVRSSVWLSIIGRLKPGMPREQAQAGIDPLWYSLRVQRLSEMGHSSERFKNEFLNSHLFLENGSKGVWNNRRKARTLLVVMGMAGLMVLMACANVGGLLLVRVASRTREISVRYALGAKRSRVIQQLLAEGLLLGLGGGLAGALLAPQICGFLTRMLWSQSIGELAFSAMPDLRILAFNFGLTFLVSLLFSLAPVIQFWRPDASVALKQQTATIARGPLRMRRALTVAQIGLSLLLLVGAGLFVRTLRNLKTLDVGFATDKLVTFSVDPRLAGYQRDQTAGLYQRILEQLAGLPGVRSVAATSDPELADTNTSSNITIAGYRAADNEDMNVEHEKVSSGYLSTLQMPVLAGRGFSDQDRLGTHQVGIVNESLARRYFGKPQDALGHYFCWGAGDVTPDIEIVGVVKDAKHTTLRSEVGRSIFTPFLQDKEAGTSVTGMTFYLRTWQAPEAAESTIRQFMHGFDSRIVLNDFRTMQEQLEENVTTERAIALLATSFGALAALMAAIGIYGVLAYSTAQRFREIGIRIAVGATRARVMRMVLTEVLWMAGAGIVIGAPLSLLLSSLVRTQLFGVSGSDPLTLCMVCGIIMAVAVASAALPARLAAKVDPIVALRYE
ncbi:MAG TPA: ABC transporter permease [Candidatus Sulfotelmatobacter sp.]|jgi:predicted permease